MTIVTRHSSPRTGTEFPVTGPSKSTGEIRKVPFSRKRMKATTTETNNTATPATNTIAIGAVVITASNVSTKFGEVSMRIQNFVSGCTEEVINVMSETTNLTPVKSAAVEGAVLSSNIEMGTLESCENCDAEVPPPTLGEQENKKVVKKVKKKKVQGSSGEDPLVACRKSRRLQNKRNRNKINKNDSPFLGTARMKELMDRDKKFDRDCLFTKVLFLGSLGLLPNYCVGPSARSPSNLKALCIRQLIKQKHEELAGTDNYSPDEKRRKLCTEEIKKNILSEEESKTDRCTSSCSSIRSLDSDTVSISSQSSPEKNSNSEGNKPSSNSDKYENEDYEDWGNWDQHVMSLIEADRLKKTSDDIENDNDKEESVKDCVAKILRIGTKIDFLGTPAPPDIQELIQNSSSNSLSNNNSNVDDDEGETWYNWEEHILSMMQEESACSNSDNTSPVVKKEPIHHSSDRQSSRSLSLTIS